MTKDSKKRRLKDVIAFKKIISNGKSLVLVPIILCLVACGNDDGFESVEEIEEVITELEKSDPEKLEQFRMALLTIYMPYGLKGVSMKETLPDEIKGLTVDEIIELSNSKQYNDSRATAQGIHKMANEHSAKDPVEITINEKLGNSFELDGLKFTFDKAEIGRISFRKPRHTYGQFSMVHELPKDRFLKVRVKVKNISDRRMISFRNLWANTFLEDEVGNRYRAKSFYSAESEIIDFNSVFFRELRPNEEMVDTVHFSVPVEGWKTLRLKSNPNSKYPNIEGEISNNWFALNIAKEQVKEQTVKPTSIKLVNPNFEEGNGLKGWRFKKLARNRVYKQKVLPDGTTCLMLSNGVAYNESEIYAKQGMIYSLELSLAKAGNKKLVAGKDYKVSIKIGGYVMSNFMLNGDLENVEEGGKLKSFSTSFKADFASDVFKRAPLGIRIYAKGCTIYVDDFKFSYKPIVR